MKEPIVRQSSNHVSGRRYLPIPCKQCTEPFVPTDRRQLYCCKQHGIDYRNDTRRKERHTRFSSEQLLRRYDRILENLLVKMDAAGISAIGEDVLSLEGFKKFDIHTERVQAKDDRFILWYYDYGLELISVRPRRFRIIARAQTKHVA